MRIFLLALTLIFSAHSTHALDKTVRVGVTGGLPNLIAGELAYVKLSPFAFGITFGGFPVQNLIASRVSLSTIPLSVTSPNTYTISPSATYYLNGMELFVNYYPWKGIFFVRLSYANLAFQLNGTGALNNVTAGTTLPGAISVVANVSQPLVSAKVGWDFSLTDSITLGTGVGVGYLLTATNTTTTGGSATGAFAIAPDADAAYNSAKASMTNSFNAAVAELNAQTRIIPSAFVTLAYGF